MAGHIGALLAVALAVAFLFFCSCTLCVGSLTWIERRRRRARMRSARLWYALTPTSTLREIGSVPDVGLEPAPEAAGEKPEGVELVAGGANTSRTPRLNRIAAFFPALALLTSFAPSDGWRLIDLDARRQRVAPDQARLRFAEIEGEAVSTKDGLVKLRAGNRYTLEAVLGGRKIGGGARFAWWDVRRGRLLGEVGSFDSQCTMASVLQVPATAVVEAEEDMVLALLVDGSYEKLMAWPELTGGTIEVQPMAPEGAEDSGERIAAR